MTAQTEWAHLPNAKYIDMILSDLKSYPDNWANVSLGALCRAAWNEAKRVIWNDRMDAIWNEAKNVASNATRSEECQSGWSPIFAIFALIAYDDCTYMLDCDPDEIKLLAKLGDHKAVLLLPACIAFNTIKIDK